MATTAVLGHATLALGITWLPLDFTPRESTRDPHRLVLGELGFGLGELPPVAVVATANDVVGFV
jgi:hypothetical protein